MYRYIKISIIPYFVSFATHFPLNFSHENFMDVYWQNREAAVRVKVKKCELNSSDQWRKFSVDPQITTLEVLYSLLAKAFDTKSDFSIKYKAFDPAGNEIYLAVLSDWDLDAAFLRIHNLSMQTASEPCLVLQMDVKPFTEVKECDAETTTKIVSKPTPSRYVSSSSGSSSSKSSIIPTLMNDGTTNTREIMTPLQQSIGVSQKYVQQMQTKLPGLIMNQMERTFSMVQKAFNLTEETMSTLSPRPPLSDSEFRLFLDALGQIQRTDELRKVIFFGGIEPGLRRVVWKHILNVYPIGMNGHQRMDYMKRKSEQYYKLRETWKTALKQGFIVGELGYVTSMVKKDVLRTDRLHPFYAGSDENQNIASLFNILTTYALNHPTVSYCQGMSDIASPLLVTMNDEAQAYICFCAIMFRLRGNFMLDGMAMTQKFAHLSEALSFYDPEFWEYLKSQQANDLLFCYRWLLLELKREFPFEDALRMLEVQWSSLKYDATTQNELSLFEKEFVPIMETSVPTTTGSLSSSLSTTGGPTSPLYLLSKPRENPYTKFCALRRQSSTASLSSLGSSLGGSNTLDTSKRLNQSLDDNISNHVSTRPQRQFSSKAHQSLDETKMLMLIESSEKDIFIQQAENSNDVQNDLEHPALDNEISSIESSHFKFHPTNPFKDDAQQFQSTIKNNICYNPPLSSRVFLKSSSSSFTEEQVIEYNEDNTDASTASQEFSADTVKLENKNILPNYNTVSNIIAKQLSNATTVNETVKRVGTAGGGHFKDLKDKIAATSNKGLSFEELTNTTTGAVKPSQKLVKNFNEFLNFANINKNRISDKFCGPNTLIVADNNCKSATPSSPQSPTHRITMPPLITHPVVQVTKISRVPSLEDSDSTSSFEPDTTWSNSTAATALQQVQDISLNLDVNSLSSTNYSYTSNRTPGVFSPLQNEVANNMDLMTDSQEAEQDYYPITTAVTRELRLEAENLDRQVFGDIIVPNAPVDDIKYEKLEKEGIDMIADINKLNLNENEIIARADNDLLKNLRKTVESTVPSDSFKSYDGSDRPIKNSAIQNSYYLEFEGLETYRNDEVFDNLPKNVNSRNVASFDNSSTAYKLSNPFIDDSLYSCELTSLGLPNSKSLHETNAAIGTTSSLAAPVELANNAVDDEEQLESFAFDINDRSKTSVVDLNGIPSCCATLPEPPVLPPPHQLGGGNPFLMFLCLTLLLQHRNTIIKNGMDYNEIAMHFDKMVRKHDVIRVLNQARRMYIDYLKLQNSYKHQMQKFSKRAKKLENNLTKTMQKPNYQQRQKQIKEFD